MTERATRRITFNSSDSLTNSKTDLIFNLQTPLTDVIYADWTLIADVETTCILSIRELQTNGLTSKGIPYFASLVGGTTQNLLVTALPNTEERPRPISNLTFSLQSLSGGPATQSMDWTIEIVFYTRRA